MLEKEILDIIIRWAIPVICAGCLGYLVNKVKAITSNAKEIDDIKNSVKELENLKSQLDTIQSNDVIQQKAILSIVRSQITSKCEIYLQMGYMPDYARYCLTELFKSYKEMGGNHGTEQLVNETLRLPLHKGGNENVK